MEQTNQIQVITAVERQKRSRVRYNIFLDGEFAFSIHEDLLVKHKLLKGESVDAERLGELLLEDEKHRAYVDAIRYISVRARAVREVRQKLTTRGYEPPLIDQIIADLERQGYLDDRSFAELWAGERMRLQKKGRKWVELELKQKGIAPQWIEAAMGKVAEDEERNYAFELAEKRWRQLNGDVNIRKRKLYDFLLRRGFSSTVTAAAVQRVSGVSAEEDWELDISSDYEDS